MKNTRQSGAISVAGAIVIAGIVIAGTLLFIGKDSTGGGQLAQGGRGAFRDVEASDHVRGSREAVVSIVEFSDFECPFCARLHPTLSQVVDDFDGEVNWVYRHFPLSQIHSRALGAAIASECVAELGDNNAFWTFADETFANQHSLSNDLYLELAKNAGIDENAFNTCIESRETNAEVTEDRNEAVDAGGRGTPFVVIVTADGELRTFSGALPYENIRALVEEALTS